MEERDLFSTGAGAGPFIDQVESITTALLQDLLNVFHLETDVMEPAASLFLDKFPDGTIRRRRLEEFKVGLSDGEKGGPGLLLLHLFYVLRILPENFFEGRYGLFKIRDGDADVVDLNRPHVLTAGGRAGSTNPLRNPVGELFEIFPKEIDELRRLGIIRLLIFPGGPWIEDLF